jgi:multidrug efflux pump subunit AcrA (membrane-fusion protein)
LPEAFLEEDESPSSRVWILENNEPVPVPVTTGRTDGRYTEIVNGAVDDGMPLVVDVIP